MWYKNARLTLAVFHLFTRMLPLRIALSSGMQDDIADVITKSCDGSGVLEF